MKSKPCGFLGKNVSARETTRSRPQKVSGTQKCEHEAGARNKLFITNVQNKTELESELF